MFGQVAGVGPAAFASSGATCFAQATVTISPGVAPKASKGTFSLSGGKIACVGSFNSTPVGSQGKFSGSGYYGTGALSGLQHGDTCAQGSGSGKISATVPKAGGGTVTVSGSFKFVRLGGNVFVAGKLARANMGGMLLFAPKLCQNCVTVKVTKATVAGQVAVGG